jgi:hypothetical protein
MLMGTIRVTPTSDSHHFEARNLQNLVAQPRSSQCLALRAAPNYYQPVTFPHFTWVPTFTTVYGSVGTKESRARDCYLSAMESCSSSWYLQTFCNNSISRCHNHRSSVLEAVSKVGDSMYDLRSNAYNVLVAIGHKNHFIESGLHLSMVSR